MTKQRLMSLLVLIISLVLVDYHDAGAHQPNPALRAEMKEYINNEVFPTLTKMKAELDSKLSSEDLEKLNKLRNEAKTIRETMRKDFMDFRNSENKEEFKITKKQHREDLKKLAKQVRPIAIDNKDALTNIFEKYREYQSKWKADIQAIIQSSKENSGDNENGNQRKFRHHKMKHFFEGANGKRAVIKFMLWDGTTELPELLDFNHNKNEINNLESDRLSKPYPNPFNSKTNIEFELAQKEELVIEVFDNNGNKVATLANKAFEQGKNIIEFNTQEYDLEAGTYYYQIKGAKTTKFGKLIFDK